MRKGERTRAAVVGKAAAVFNEKGYARTTVQDLVARTGLERGGLYNHFDGKEALALAAFDHAAALVRARVEAAVEAAGARAPDRLDALVDVFAGLVDDPPLPGGCPILNAAVESADAFPALRERARDAMDQWARALAGTAKRGVAAGELRADLDHRRLATVVISTLEGAVMLSRLYDDPARMRVAADHIRAWLREQST
jgi:AcrR family transcriptional regulator